MKAPKPAIPKGAPGGTVWFGGSIEWLSIRLRIVGDDLVLDELTKLLGCVPDSSGKRNRPARNMDGNILYVDRKSWWNLELKPKDTDEWDVGEAMMLVLRRLPSDIALWQQLTKRYKVDFFIYLSMPTTNKGFSLSPEVMKYLGERGILTGFDIYYEPPENGQEELKVNEA